MAREMITQKGLNQFNIDIDQIPEGTYFLRLIGSSIDQQPMQFVKVK